MVRIAEAQHRLFENVFVCKKCKSKLRSDSNRVRNKQVKCRKCQGKALRAIRLKK
jgi:ribosomal protein L40E